MILPEKIKMSRMSFVDGGKGFAQQQMRNVEFSVSCVATRKTRGGVWSDEWTADALPGKTFPTYAELRAAIIATDQSPP